MTRLTSALGRTVAVVALATVALTLVAGFIGAVLRFTFWGAAGAHPMHGAAYGPMHGGGVVSMHGDVLAAQSFQLGFGLPLWTVLSWALPLALLAGAVYLLVWSTAAATRRDGETGGVA
jgi:hypothetical protein